MRFSAIKSLILCMLALLILGVSVVPAAAQNRKKKTAAKRATQRRPAEPKGTGTYEEYPVERDEVICFALYTVANKTLKITAQLYPLKPDEDRDSAVWRSRTAMVGKRSPAPR